MNTSIILRFVMVAIGVIYLIWDYIALIKKQMADILCIGWMVVCVIIILMGSVSPLSNWTALVSGMTGMALLLFMAVVSYGLFRLCFWISDLFFRNRELAMQVALLNQENQDILKRIEQLEKDSAN